MVEIKVIVTGLESSGTKWMTNLLSLHPRVSEAIHTSIPEYLMCHEIKTRWPKLTGADYVVWMLRYEPFRLRSIKRLEYDLDRDPQFVPPALYENCARLYRNSESPVIMVSYEGMVGPCGLTVFQDVLARMKIDISMMPPGFWHPEDANAKYVSGG